MATSWDTVKTILPNGDERAYIFSQYFPVTSPATGLPECQWAPSGIGPCTYFAGVGTMGSDSWQPGYPFGSIAGLPGTYPQVGEWVSTIVTNTQTGVVNTFCNKCIAVIDKDTFLSGTCLECYNNGNAANCSDNFTPVPTIPLPGDPGGCRYDNSINFNGIGLSYWAAYLQGGGWNVVTYIAPNCDDCVSPTGPPPPPSSTLNVISNCCDPSEQYQFSPNSGIYNQLVNIMGAVDTNAFRADLYIGGAHTGMKCWQVGTHLQPQMIPFAYGITMDPQDLWPNCLQLKDYMHNSPIYPDCCDYEPCDPLNPYSPLYLQWHIPAVVDQFCQECVTPGSANYNHQDCICCSGGTQCDPPVAALQNLQAKVKGFSDRRNKALNEPVADERENTAFRNTETKTYSRGRVQQTQTKGTQVASTQQESSSGGQSGGVMPSGGSGGGY